MSDNYCEASEVYDLPKDAVKYAMELYSALEGMYDLTEEEIKSEAEGNPLKQEAIEVCKHNNYDYDEMACGPGFDAEIDNRGWLWVYGEDNINVENVAAFLMQVLKKFDLSVVLSMQFCWYSSKPIAGDFGGGCVAVSKDAEKWENTNELSRRLVESLRGKVV